MITALIRPKKSTIVRSFPPRGRCGSRSASWSVAAPALGARWAERIWFTTAPAARPRRGPVAGGHPVRGRVDGHRVSGIPGGPGPPSTWCTAGPGAPASSRRSSRPLVGAGFRVVAFDAPSHGASAPARTGRARRPFPSSPHALTAVVAVQGRRTRSSPTRWAPPPPPSPCATGWRRASGLPGADGESGVVRACSSPQCSAPAPRTLRRLMTRIERRVGRPMRHFDVPELGRAVAMPPTLIVHDRDDASTPSPTATRSPRPGPGRAHVTSGLGHRRILRDPGVVAEVVDFVSG